MVIINPSLFSPYYIDSIYRLINQFNGYYTVGNLNAQLKTIHLLLISLPNSVKDETLEIRKLFTEDIHKIILESASYSKKSEIEQARIRATQDLLLLAKEKIGELIEKAGINTYTGLAPMESI